MKVRKKASDLSTPCKARDEHLKDEVYRQMFRLETNRPGADLGLALALLRAWLASDSKFETGESRAWLKKVCPICLLMIESSVRARESSKQGV